MQTNGVKDMKTEKKDKPKATGWDNLFIKKQVALGVNKQDIPEVEKEVSTDTAVETYETVTKNVMERVLFEYFYQKISSIITTRIVVTCKVFRRKIGFGFIAEDDRYFKSKAVRVDRSTFFSQEQQSLVAALTKYNLYSEVYNIWQTRQTKQTGKTFFIFRHFLAWSSLTAEQKAGMKVATTQTVGGSTAVVFVDPICVDEEYAVIEHDQTDGAWFLVVSEHANLPLRMRSMFQTNSLSCSMSLTGLTLFQKLLLGSFSIEF